MVIIPLIALGALIAYLLTKTVLAICFLGFLPILFILSRIFGDAKIIISISYGKIILLSAFLIPLMALYSYTIFAIGNKTLANLPEFMITFVLKFIFSFAIAVVVGLSAWATGRAVFKRRDVVGLACGFVILSLVFFFLAFFGKFFLWEVFAVLLIPLVFSLQLPLRKTRKFLKKKTELKQNSALLFLTAVVFVASLFVISLKGFVEGPDGLRLYLNITKFIALNGRLPKTELFSGIPFPFEVLAAIPFLAGGVTCAKFFLNSFVLFIAWEIYLIAKKLGLKTLWVPIIVILTHPILFYLVSVEFKTELFLIFLLLAAFIAFLENSTLSFFLFAASVIVKPTALFMAIPFCLAAIIYQFKEKHLKKMCLGLILATVPIIIWAVFWSLSVPYFGEIKILAKPYYLSLADRTACNPQIIEYEQNTYYGGAKSFLTNLAFPISQLFTSNGWSSLSSLTDYGLIYFVFFFVFLYIFFQKIIRREKMNLSVASRGVSSFRNSNSPSADRVLSPQQVAEYSTIPKINFINGKFVVPLLISFVPWLATRPDALWYTAVPFFLLLLLFWNFLEGNLDKEALRFVTFFVGVISCLYMLTYSFIDPYITYIPPNFGESRRMAFTNIYEAGKLVGENQKILFSSSLPFVRIDYFFQNSPERVIYFDRLSEIYKDQDKFKNLLGAENIGYAVYFKEADNTKIPCVVETQNQAEILFKDFGQLLMENDSVKVYKF